MSNSPFPTEELIIDVVCDWSTDALTTAELMLRKVSDVPVLVLLPTIGDCIDWERYIAKWKSRLSPPAINCRMLDDYEWIVQGYKHHVYSPGVKC